MHKHYDRERPENETFPADAGPQTPTPVVTIKPHYQAIDPRISRRPDQDSQTLETPAERAAKDAARIRQLKDQRDQLQLRISRRYGEVSRKFDACLDQLKGARETEDYARESQLAARAAELQQSLPMAEKIRDRALEEIQRIEAELSALEGGLDGSGQLESLAA